MGHLSRLTYTTCGTENPLAACACLGERTYDSDVLEALSASSLDATDTLIQHNQHFVEFVNTHISASLFSSCCHFW